MSPLNPLPVSPSWRLPDALRKSSMFLDLLRRAGTLDGVNQRLYVARRPGFCLVDALVFLVAYFASDRSIWGLRGFYDGNRGWTEVLGTIAGRSQLMSPSALSRFLSAVTHPGLSEFGSWLLRDGAGALELLRSPHVQALDGRGEHWHVLNLDPTRQAVRQRALPEGPDLPPAQRRASRLCAPGHFGRKRGEVGFSEYQLQHQGCALILDTTVRAGNGDCHPQFRSAVRAAVECANALGHPLSRMMICTDGEFGQVSFLSDAKRACVAVLTRCSRYLGVLAEPELRARLRTSQWSRVPDSGSGPARYAVDLGLVTLSASEDLLREDGSPYEPVTVRLIASRFKGRSGSGWSLDDDRLELFIALDIESTAWSATDLVATYYGRIAQENRFSQFDQKSCQRCKPQPRTW